MTKPMPFADLPWFACASTPRPRAVGAKKAAQAPPSKPAVAVSKAVVKNPTFNLWTQTPPGGLKLPVQNDEKEKAEKRSGEKTEAAQRKSRYWRKFYRENQLLIRGSYDAELWSTFSNRWEDEEEPKRSKFWRGMFRKHPDDYLHESDDSDESNFDSSFDDESSDTDPEITVASPSSSIRAWRVTKLKEAIERSEKSEKNLPGRASSPVRGEKHVHFSDEDSKLKGILKKPSNVVKEKAIFNPPGSFKKEETKNEEGRASSLSGGLTVNIWMGGSNQSSGPQTRGPQNARTESAPNNTSRQNTNIVETRQAKTSHPHPQHNRPQNTNNAWCAQPPSWDFVEFSKPAQNSPRVLQHSQQGTSQPRQFNTIDPVVEYYYLCPWGYVPARPGLQSWLDPNINRYVPVIMESQGNGNGRTRNILPVSAHVLIVEHLLELPSDPRPNAFYDSRTGCLRVYHGNVYGNPNGTLMPPGTEQMLGSNLGSTGMAGMGFGSFPPGGAGFNVMQAGSHGPFMGQMNGAYAMGAHPGTVEGPPPGLLRGSLPMVNGMPFFPSTYGNPSSMMTDLERMQAARMFPWLNSAAGINQFPVPVPVPVYDPMMINRIVSNNMSTMNSLQNTSPMLTNPSNLSSQAQNNHGNGGGNSGRGNGNGNGNGGGNNQNSNRNFSNNSSNHNQQHRQNNQNQNNQGRSQSRNASNAGSQSGNNRNNNRSSNSNSSNTNGGGGNSSWDNNNAGNSAQDDSWGNSGWDNNDSNSAPDNTWGDNNGTSDPAPAVSAPSPTPTVVHNVIEDPFSSGEVVDPDRTPTLKHAHIPGAFPESTYKNDSSSNSNDNNNNNNNDSGNSWGGNNDSSSTWEPDVTSGINDDWASGFDDNTNNNSTFIRADETVLTTGSWKSASPQNKKGNSGNNKNNKNNNGYNLKQTNNTSSSGWGDPTAAQSTGGNGGW